MIFVNLEFCPAHAGLIDNFKLILEAISLCPLWLKKFLLDKLEKIEYKLFKEIL